MIKIALLDSKLNVIGWKADTFWSLVDDDEFAKIHKLDDYGNIPYCLIENLRVILDSSDTSSVVDRVCFGYKKYLLSKDLMFVGWKEKDSLINLAYRIEDNQLQKMN